MSESTLPAPAAEIPAPTGTPSANPAIARCRQAYETARRNELKNGRKDYEAKDAGGEAYRRAMPPLSGYENIRDFIACVAHGMLIGAIGYIDGAQYLYAAQVATSALRCQPKGGEPSVKPKPPKREI